MSYGLRPYGVGPTGAHLLSASAGGAAVVLVATSAAVSAATVALTTSILLASTPSAAVSITAALSTGIPLAATSTAATTATVGLTSGIKLVAAPASTTGVVADLSTAQMAHPSSDLLTGTWTSSLGGSLFAPISEPNPNDADYISAAAASTCKVALSAVSAPSVTTGHILHYRVVAVAGNLTVSLMQGATVIASWAHTPAPTSLTQFDQTLTGTQAGNITDYTALSLQFAAS